jgi:DNA-binding response OmpR family regulator
VTARADQDSGVQVLLAEDDTTMRRGIATLLEAEAMTCLPAADGTEALRLFRARRPTFCIIDITMPGMSGFDLCRSIRAENQDVPIIMLTARDTETDRVVGLELGADDYIAKPFSPRELVARVRALRRRAERKSGGVPRRPPESFRMGDLTVDPAGLRAYRDDTVIDLTPREVDILTTLHQHRNRVVSRDMLFDQCWGRDFMPNSRALDQSIVVLRRKIERDPKAPRIVATVHGAGYRYDEDPAAPA